MKKIIWVYGIIAGLIVGGWLFLATAIIGHERIENGMFLGYASMVLAFSMIFVAVKTFRDKHLDGTISFGKAFSIGFLITLIASTIYVLTWEVSFHYFVPDYMEKYAEKTIEGLRNAGKDQAAIDKQAAEMKSFGEMYKNPLVRLGFSYMEILPVGLLISLIVALILKRKALPGQAVPA